MRFAFKTSPQNTTWADMLAVWKAADGIEVYESGWTFDHFYPIFSDPTGPCLEGWTTLTALAQATERLRLGTLVTGIPYRHPAVLANVAAAIDQVTGGRFVLGLGAGWQQNEHDQYGIELPPVGERVARFGEHLAVVRSLLTEPRTTVDGRWYRVTDALCEPKPVQDPLPILVGGKGDRMLGLTARWADAWNMWGLPEVVAGRAAVLNAACERIDRDPATIARSTQALVLLTDDDEAARRFLDAVAPRAAYAGPVAGFAELVAAWRETGVDEVIVPDAALGSGARRLDAMDAIAEAVAPLR